MVWGAGAGWRSAGLPGATPGIPEGLTRCPPPEPARWDPVRTWGRCREGDRRPFQPALPLPRERAGLLLRPDPQLRDRDHPAHDRGPAGSVAPDHQADALHA